MLLIDQQRTGYFQIQRAAKNLKKIAIKLHFGGFEAVRGHIPMRSKVILKAPWAMVLTQPKKKFLLDILL